MCVFVLYQRIEENHHRLTKENYTINIMIKCDHKCNRITRIRILYYKYFRQNAKNAYLRRAEICYEIIKPYN